jgi:hypothetical protein
MDARRQGHSPHTVHVIVTSAQLGGDKAARGEGDRAGERATLAALDRAWLGRDRGALSLERP